MVVKWLGLLPFNIHADRITDYGYKYATVCICIHISGHNKVSWLKYLPYARFHQLQRLSCPRPWMLESQFFRSKVQNLQLDGRHELFSSHGHKKQELILQE